MRLKRIKISNMRLIGEEPKVIEVAEDKNFLILLGNNGEGKTTILDAIATTVAPFAMQFPQISDFQLSDMDVHIKNNGKRAKYLCVDALFGDGEREMPSIRYRKGVQNPPEGNYAILKSEALGRKEAIINGDGNVPLPVLAYYGTGRGQIKAPERKRDFQKVFEPWDCYKNALSPATDFKRFFEWFDRMEDEERRERERLWEKGYRLPLLEAVRKAIDDFVAPTLSNPRILTSPLRFVLDKKETNGTIHELRMEQMSDGYKIVIAMVADIAARMAEANPWMANPLDGKGIVLIDEVDLHLHPKWQRVILSQLKRTFPNVQFIVSTHSPIIVVGAADFAQLVLLDPSETNVNVNCINENIGQILLGNLFELPSLHSPKWDSQISERDSLLAKTERTEEENLRLQELDGELSKVSALESPEAIESRMLVKKIAEQLGITI